MTVIHTIGHSTHPIADFIGLLKAHDIQILVDVRTIPRSRYNPQFEGLELAKSLKEEGIIYHHMKGLGGLRHPRQDSPNRGWRNDSFRGYADYMQTPDFQKSLEDLIALSQEGLLAIMCAESVPWRCHRSLIADALIVRGIEVVDIMPEGKISKHKINPMAVVKSQDITYPPDTAELPGL